MPQHESRPLRKRAPWIGCRPGVFVPLPPRRPRPALIIAAATALLPRALPPQPQITRVRRLTPPPAAEQRQPTLTFRTTPAVLLNRGGAVLIGDPSRTTVPLASGLKGPRVIRLASPAVLFNRGGAALLGPPHRPAAVVPGVPGSLRTIRVYGGRGRLSLPVVPGTGSAIAVTAGPVGLRTVTVSRFLTLRPQGTVFVSRVPARTVRLASFQEDALIVRRDERRYAGAVFLNKVPDRTLRLDPFQEAALVVRRDERRYPGAVFTVKVPARTVRLEAFQTRASVLLRPCPEPKRGAVWLGAPHRDTTARPAKSPALARGLPPPFRGSVFTSKVPDRTLRLDACQEGARVVQRDERRFAGRVVLGAPSRTGAAVIVPSIAKLLARVVRRDERRFSGAVYTDRVPARTLRLDAAQEQAPVIRRDERRYAGAVLLTHVPARTVRLTPGELAARVVPPPAREARRGSLLVGSPRRDTSPKPSKRALIAAPTPPRPAGSVFTVRVPARTVRLTPAQLTAVRGQADRRGFAGRVLIGSPSRTAVVVVVSRVPRPVLVSRETKAFAGRLLLGRVPSRTVRLDAFQTRALLVRRDERRYGGALFLAPAPRPKGPAGAARGPLTVRQAPAFPAVRPVVLVAPKRRSFVLAAGLTKARISTRQSFPPRGAVLLVRPVRPKVSFRIPEAAVIRRDERGFAGRQTISPVSRTNPMVSMLGNPRARLTRRAGPAALLTVRPGPTAAVTRRPAPVAALTFKEG